MKKRSPTRAPQNNPLMPVVNVSDAKTQPSRLVRLVEAGEKIIIARRDQPVAKLVRYQPGGKRRFGVMKGKMMFVFGFLVFSTELLFWQMGLTRRHTSITRLVR